jgi:hypothetical protein
MKRLQWIPLFLAVTPALLSAESKKMTVGELQDMMTSLHHAQKNDQQVANELKQIELTEELTPAAMNGMVDLVDGPLSTEQMYVLEARSSMLAPPATDLPKTAPPDAVAQQALLAKAENYATKTYPQLPRMTATRLVARFQDGVETIQSYVGAAVRSVNDTDPLWQQQVHQYVRLMNTRTDTVEIASGIEKPESKDTTPWGRNGFLNSMLPFLPLNELTSEVVSSGNPKFLRWETIAGRPTEVFSFAVEKKKSHYALNYCCFPETSSVGNVLYNGSAAHPVDNGNLTTVSNWEAFKTKSGYHGELFIDPDSGTIVRTIVEAEFKPSDFVHYEDIRVDYASMPIGGRSLYVPVRSFTIAEVVPNGDSFATQYAIRHQFVTQDFKDFQPVDAATAEK